MPRAMRLSEGRVTRRCQSRGNVTQTLPNGTQHMVSFVVVYRVNGGGKIVSLKAYWQFEKVM